MDFFRRLRGESKPEPARSGEVADIYMGLRDSVLNLDPASVGITPTPAMPVVWGLLMDRRLENGIVTIVSLADGTTSLYVSSGGGSIGAGRHPAAAAASVNALTMAASVLDQFPVASTAPLPGPESTALTVLTFSGLRRIEEETRAFRTGNLSAVSDAMERVISEIHRAEEAPR